VVVGGWIDKDDNAPTRGGTGGDLPARIGNEFVSQSAAARAKAVRLHPRAAALSAPAAGDIPSAPSAGVIRGLPIVQTTGMLEIQGRVVPLFGVEGVRGRPAREFTRYLGSREVACEPAGSGNAYRCGGGDGDLCRGVWFRGGARASAKGTGAAGARERRARASRVGIWSGREED